MEKRDYERDIKELAAKRDGVERFSPEWFQLVAEIEDLRTESLRHTPRAAYPASYTPVDWRTYDDE